MVQVQDLKIFLQLMGMLQVGVQLGIVAVAFPLDFLDNQLGVAFY
jgi:hypothetical protein